MKLLSKLNFLILFSFLVASIFFLFNRAIWQNLYLFSNSDFLYTPFLVRDFEEGIYNWKLWILPPAPSFFPDLFLYFLLSIFSKTLAINLTIYGFAISLILIYFTSKVFRLTEEYFSFNRIFKAVTLGYTFLFFYFSFYPEDIGLFLVPSYHSSSFLFSVILYSLIFNTSNRKGIILFVVISTLAIISDKQIYYTFFFPLIVTSFLLRNGSIEKYYLKVTVYLVLGTLLSIIFMNILSAFRIFNVPTIPVWNEIKKNIFQGQVIDNLKHSIPLVKQYFIDFYLDKFFIFCLFVVTVALNIYYSLPISKAKSGVRFLSLSILMVYFFSIASQMFFGIWGGFRYMWAIYLFPFLSVFYYTGNALSKMLIDKNFRKVGTVRRYVFLLSRNKKRSQRFFLGIILIFISLCGYFFISSKTKDITIQDPYPPFISCLDGIKETYNLKYGISDYWNAKHIRYLSHKKLIVNQVFANIEKYNWVHNRQWYEKDLEGNEIRYNFLIPERLDRTIIVQKYGEPEKIEKCSGKEIYIYKNGFSF